ncbi:MAG: cyclic nucleotide-binding domain-containing protein, partial [Bryobacteraceae bacterium]
MGTIAQGMGQNAPLEVLRAHRFTKGLSDSQLSALLALARPVRFEADEIVLSDGQRSSDFYLLVSGSVVVELCAPQFTVCVQSLGPGDVFGWS